VLPAVGRVSERKDDLLAFNALLAEALAVKDACAARAER